MLRAEEMPVPRPWGGRARGTGGQLGAAGERRGALAGGHVRAGPGRQVSDREKGSISLCELGGPGYGLGSVTSSN